MQNRWIGIALAQKLWVKIVAAVVVVFLLVLVLVPLFVNADTFRPTIEADLSKALGRKVTLGHLSFSLLKGSLTAENISVSDDPAFSTSPFVQARKLEIGVETGPLIFHKRVQITRITVDSASIHLIDAQNGRWNFSSIGNASAKQPAIARRDSSIPDLTVGQLDINDGAASISSIPATHKSFTVSKINLTIKQFSFLKSFPFNLSASLPGASSLTLEGVAGPISQKNAVDTPFHASLKVKGFDPVAAGLVEPNQGISMVADIDAQQASDGSVLSTNGKIQASRLQLARNGTPATQPVNIDYVISHNLSTRDGQVKSLNIHAGSVAAQVTGSYRLTPQAVVLDLRLTAPNLPIDQVEQLLPAFGVRLPSGSALRGGTLTANLSVTGPATATTTTGPVSIDNTTLAGFDLGSKIQGLSALNGHTTGGTQIQNLRANVSSSPQVTQISNIYGNLPQLGTATGSGTVSPSGALNFNMVATLTSSNIAGAAANQAINMASGYLNGFLHPNAKPAASNKNQGIPLTITGTASNPSIHANVGAMLR